MRPLGTRYSTWFGPTMTLAVASRFFEGGDPQGLVEDSIVSVLEWCIYYLLLSGSRNWLATVQIGEISLRRISAQIGVRNRENLGS